mmetsp:Transcript_6570/g.12427  ORF Transcript_6570/g.12427 Transcript_6570/m.12427 type:complete len:200 (-) Transcript_6570:446-1045(-)
MIKCTLHVDDALRGVLCVFSSRQDENFRNDRYTGQLFVAEVRDTAMECNDGRSVMTSHRIHQTNSPTKTISNESNSCRVHMWIILQNINGGLDPGDGEIKITAIDGDLCNPVFGSLRQCAIAKDIGREDNVVSLLGKRGHALLSILTYTMPWGKDDQSRAFLVAAETIRFCDESHEECVIVSVGVVDLSDGDIGGGGET